VQEVERPVDVRGRVVDVRRDEDATATVGDVYAGRGQPLDDDFGGLTDRFEQDER
jgi:hypothetical protein